MADLTANLAVFPGFSLSLCWRPLLPSPLRCSVKETDAGATSRVLPMGDGLPLKAWQGCAWVGDSRGLAIFVFFGYTPPPNSLLITQSSLALLGIIEKKLYRYSLFHPDMFTSATAIFHTLEMCLTFLFFLNKISIQQITTSVKKHKNTTGQKRSKNLLLFLLVLKCHSIEFNKSKSKYMLLRSIQNCIHFHRLPENARTVLQYLCHEYQMKIEKENLTKIFFFHIF